MNSGYNDGYVQIDDAVENSISIREIEDELDDYYIEQIDAYLGDSNYYLNFEDEIENLKSLNKIEIENIEIEKTHQRLIFSGAITCMEDYLSTTLIRLVLEHDGNFRSFVRTYKNFKNRRFNLSEIFEKNDELVKIVKKELLDIIYHDLPKVKGIFKDTLDIDLVDISELVKKVQTRHDMVHRNGKTKDGEVIDISSDMVEGTIQKVEEFVDKLEKKINDKFN